MNNDYSYYLFPYFICQVVEYLGHVFIPNELMDCSQNLQLLNRCEDSKVISGMMLQKIHGAKPLILRARARSGHPRSSF